eukprot:scaffold56236_cov19-Prasinocladus_malaysianus.AAC.1
MCGAECQNVPSFDARWGVTATVKETQPTTCKSQKISHKKPWIRRKIANGPGMGHWITFREEV